MLRHTYPYHLNLTDNEIRHICVCSGKALTAKIRWLYGYVSYSFIDYGESIT